VVISNLDIKEDAMNKRLKKKVCCPKCGTRQRQFAIRMKKKYAVDLCKVCHFTERRLMREVMVEVGQKIPALGAFMNIIPWGML
jgi:transcription elongation factor Elf1